MNLDKRTVYLIIGILERTVNRVAKHRDTLPSRGYTALYVNLTGKLEALSETINLLKLIMMEEQNLENNH